MTFRQFAIKNVQRNYKAYLAYFLSSTLSILVFFLFAVNLFHPMIGESFTSGPVHSVLSAGEVAISIFSLLFILYSVGTFLKTRSGEFGLLTMLGATRKQLNRLISLENIIIGLAAMVTGITTGLFLSKYFLMFASMILEVPELEFYIPVKAILFTIICFLIIFVLISSLAPFAVRSKEIIELLKGNRKPKEPPKASIWLSIAALILIGAGYIIVVLQMAIPFDLGVIAILVSAGTYLFYSQLSVFALKRLATLPTLFFRKTNLIWISDLVYRMKDNARLLFVVTLTCTVSFTTMAAFFSIYQTVDEEYAKSFPIPFSYFSYSSDVQRESNLSLITSKLDEEELSYQTVSVPFLEFDNGSRQKTAALSTQDYNRLAQLLNRKQLQLKPGEVIEVSIWTSKADTHITIKENETVNLGSDTLRIIGVVQDNIFPEGSFGNLYILNDLDFEKQGSILNKGVYYGYAVPDWTEASTAAEKIDAQMGTDFTAFMYRSSPDWYKTDQLTYKLILFVGSFISIVFFIAAGSFIYFRFYTDVQEEKVKYRNLRKIGMTIREVKKIVTVQLAILFFIPFLIAALHSVFALQTLQARMSASLGSSASIILIFFFAALSIYFLLLRSRYMRSLLEEA
ncbi:FtsX-like permease family protein [Paenibacillus sp. L3-i20]|uniref:FtsX-like permease family protein n=1 Tax=Paenibacillus sp. L3-i20 TaxID=2905833 RepID=UPI001EDE8E1A|nr:ABC transporter permease [Paenibacillus sp. L3-i20]GKU77265.1 ABC transporter permease [Paenibacillus sp. L3-i20]